VVKNELLNRSMLVFLGLARGCWPAATFTTARAPRRRLLTFNPALLGLEGFA